ncbi:M56 family metallopeptidase [Aquimarina sp. AU474]|uniref:M56 family metallopeptidase n=1 Tax=Aquimarina sp. AU474 TaxID=2108529 RepID=UPI000D68BBCA|nr:M56 family metallopeptidase [Aquimarina sp. AU474]
MLQYILYVVIFQLFFLVVYDIFHKKDTFFSLNRAYLLFTSILSLILPFIKIDRVREVIPEEYVVSLPAVIIGEQNPSTSVSNIIETNPFYSQINWLFLVYGIGVFVMLFLFVKKNYKLQKLRRKSTLKKINTYHLCIIPNSKDAFSFWNTIYMGDQIDNHEKEQIIIHEIVHLNEKHTLDLLWCELLKIIFWFNPLVYIYQSKLNSLHEFIADAKSIVILGRKKYYEQLLHTVFDTEDIAFINQFFSRSLLKKRIAMLQKNKSKKIAKFKYIMVIPILITMIIFSSFSENKYHQKTGNIIVQEIENDSLDAALIKKFKKELAEMVSNNASLEELNGAFSLENKNGVISRESYLKTQVFFGYIIQQHLKKARKNNELSPEEENSAKQLLKGINRSYNEFIETGKDKNITLTDEKKQEPKSTNTSKDAIPFAKVDKVPSTKKCAELTNSSEIKKCVSDEIKKLVNRNFKTDVLKDNGLVGINRIYVRFKIDTLGNIVDIQARGPLPQTETEAKRVIAMLPQMIPGELNGEKVEVLYSLPIVINIPKEESENQAYKSETRKNNITRISDQQILTETLTDSENHDIESGYYLISNIFKHDSYYQRGLKNLKNIGLPVKSFKNPKDKYFYVYLDRYDELEEAKKMLLNNFNGRFYGDLYILKINGK